MQLKKKLLSGDFVTLAEMDPPKGTDTAAMVAAALAVKTRVDAFVVPEMANAVMKLSALGGALLLQSRGLETVMQVCCRDRNRLALQGDLLAAQALGVPNVMAVAGEDITFGDHHLAKSVNDVSLVELLQAIQTMKKGKDMAGVDLMGAPSFTVGSTVKVGLTGPALDQEVAELGQKLANGATFFLTPAVFDLDVLDRFRRRVNNPAVKLIPTVLLLKSVGMARYIDRHIDQISIPNDVILRVQKAPERVRECVAIAAELVKAIRDKGYAGVNIATLGWEDKLPAILSAAG
jgi:5,10-methylenetetrahydrofolate reductase